MIKNWIEAMRPRTLPVSVAGVVTAIGLAVWRNVFDWRAALLCFLFAVLAQIASNFANEYYDYVSGIDKVGRIGPRRGVTEGDITPKAMKYATFITLFLACAVGCCLISFGGLWLIWVGILIVLFALAYSTGPYPLSRHGFGDIAVVIFFGIVPVNFTFYVQSGYFSLMIFLTSLSIGLMAMNVLVVNNYRDMEDDMEAGKITTVTLFGRTVASIAYMFSGFIAIGILSALWLSLPLWGLVAPIVYLCLHTATWIQLQHSCGRMFNKVLGATARNMLLFSLLLLGELILSAILR